MAEYVVSACLLGTCCKYNGGHNAHAGVKKICETHTYVAVCPEVVGCFGVPRAQSEICGGSGEDVVAGTASVRTVDGCDISEQFLRGAREALAYAQREGCTKAILKARSPSCGVGTIYDGSFTGTLKKGNGVFAALLMKNGFAVYTEDGV